MLLPFRTTSAPARAKPNLSMTKREPALPHRRWKQAMSILEIQSAWRLKSKPLNLFSRVLVPLAAEDPLVYPAAMTTSVQRYQEYGRSIWDLRNDNKENA